MTTIRVSSLAKKMAEQNHCLIAGMTGAGKSVVINNIIHYIGTRDPRCVNISIIDLKRISLARWKKMPHVTDYSVTPEDALDTIRSIESEMNRRYIYLENTECYQYKGNDIYLIIDEAADLLDTIPEVKTVLKRILRLARAVNIHVIMATQSPNRQTIPADLTLNIGCRLGLRCRSSIESRQITGYSGCETLPKYGKGYYIDSDMREPSLVNVPMVTDNEIIYMVNELNRRYQCIRK